VLKSIAELHTIRLYHYLPIAPKLNPNPGS